MTVLPKEEKDDEKALSRLARAFKFSSKNDPLRMVSFGSFLLAIRTFYSIYIYIFGYRRIYISLDIAGA